jgi:hypothetical protein
MFFVGRCGLVVVVWLGLVTLPSVFWRGGVVLILWQVRSGKVACF